VLEAGPPSQRLPALPPSADGRATGPFSGNGAAGGGLRPAPGAGATAVSWGGAGGAAAACGPTVPHILLPTAYIYMYSAAALYSAARLRYSVLVQRFMIPTFQPVLLTLIPHSAGFRSFLDGSLLPSWILVYVEN
jgi:hypothetical protein